MIRLIFTVTFLSIFKITFAQNTQTHRGCFFAENKVEKDLETIILPNLSYKIDF